MFAVITHLGEDGGDERLETGLGVLNNDAFGNVGKLLAQRFLEAYVACILGLQPFQEMQLAIELHTESVAEGSMRFHRLHALETWLTVGELG